MMKKRRKLLIGLGILAGIIFVAGLTALAVTNYGSKSDPLVTLSYLNKTVTPSINDQLDDSIEDAKEALSDSFDSKLNSSGGTADAEAFSVVSLSKGQTLKCAVGTEIMLRIGSVASAGPDSPRLIDETDGTQLSDAGSALVKNHMYMVTIVNNGITATSSAKVLIRGSYTVS